MGSLDICAMYEKFDRASMFPCAPWEIIKDFCPTSIDEKAR